MCFRLLVGDLANATTYNDYFNPYAQVCQTDCYANNSAVRLQPVGMTVMASG